MSQNQYAALTQRHQKEVNALPIHYAFGNTQFEEKAKALGFKNASSLQNQAVTIYGVGDFVLAKDYPLVKETLARHRKEKSEAIAADTDGTGFIFDMFDYELSNHEYGYTRDPESALDALGLSYKDLAQDERLYNGFTQACKNQAEWYDKHNSSEEEEN